MPPPPPGIAGLCFFGSSATIASVVISRPAMEAAPCSACAHHFGRVDDALRHQVAILAGLCVIAEGVGVLFQDLANDDRAILAGVDRDLARRPGERLLDDFDAGSLIVVVDFELLQQP